MNEYFNEKTLIRDLKIDAHAIGIPIGAAEVFIENTITSIKKQLKSKSIITKKDLGRMVTKELKKYNADLAYVYQNRDKIV